MCQWRNPAQECKKDFSIQLNGLLEWWEEPSEVGLAGYGPSGYNQTKEAVLTSVVVGQKDR